MKARSSEKFLSFYKEIMDAQHFPFYIILSNYVRCILFYQNKDHKVRQIRFHVCIKRHGCKSRVCKERRFSDILIHTYNIIHIRIIYVKTPKIKIGHLFKTNI